MDDNSFFSIDRLVEFGLGMGIAQQNDGELSQLISQKRINKDTLAWVPGLTAWKPIEQIPAILKVVALTPPPLSV